MAKNKKNEQRQYNQNVVKRVFHITKQTNYWINEMCAYEGLSERQGGRIIDKLTRNSRAATDCGYIANAVWLQNKNVYQCSNCKRFNKNNFYLYCPWCGAKIKGEKTNG